MTVKTFKEFCEKESEKTIKFRTKIFTGEDFSFELRKEWRGDKATSPQKFELLSADNRTVKIEKIPEVVLGKVTDSDCRVEKDGKGNIVVQTLDLQHPLVVSTLTDFIHGYFENKEYGDTPQNIVLGLILNNLASTNTDINKALVSMAKKKAREEKVQ